MRFNVGDLVVVSAEDNMTNPLRNSKVMCKWQGPYEVMSGSPPEYAVRLLGDDADETSDVHWRKMRRIAGPDFDPSEEVIASAQHDRAKFKVDHFVDWVVDDDGEVDLLVHWKHHGEEQRTWEALLQLCEDVPVMVAKYVEEIDAADLTTAHDDCVAQLAAGNNDDE